jgi:antirestriction protein ArdC
MMSELTKVFIYALENRVVPWQRSNGFPSNIGSELRYDGIIPLILQLVSQTRGFNSAWWGTESQWMDTGRRIQSGAKPVGIPLYNGKNCSTINRGIALYNLNQTGESSPQVQANYQLAETVWRGTNANIRFVRGKVACYYYPPLDSITFPLREQFILGVGGINAYYYELFHELAHWSEPKLKWWHPNPSIKEMRAEIVASYLTTEMGIPNLQLKINKTHAQWLPHWIKEMQKDSDLILRISVDAAVATDYILGRSGLVQPRHKDIV